MSFSCRDITNLVEVPQMLSHVWRSEQTEGIVVPALTSVVKSNISKILVSFASIFRRLAKDREETDILVHFVHVSVHFLGLINAPRISGSVSDVAFPLALATGLTLEFNW